ncbi:MAG TPA: flagellar biosynthesis anti-sigma factor FlgM [Bryobacteraceae bacterium]|jgi:flagellar biosynthesis anti-sigma factor FlgM|nr:flagellar biosynthesis anti-sigma factor FlgM [Bryobacteraceae bacterium]
MKVNDSISTSLTPAGTSGTQETARMGQSSSAGTTQTTANSSNDDVHLSELVKSLRSLAAESPERQAKLESLARSYANGSYAVDAGATASKVIDDAFEN